MWNIRLDSQAGIKIARRNINNFRYGNDTILMAESEEKLTLFNIISWLKSQRSKNWYHSIWSHHFMSNRWGNNGNSDRLYFFRPPNHCRSCLQPWNWKRIVPWKKSYGKSRQPIKKQRHFFANKGPPSQSYGFSSSHVWMWELDHKKGWVLKNWCFWTVVLDKTLEIPLDWKGDQASQS